MSDYDYTPWVAPVPADKPSHLSQVVLWIGRKRDHPIWQVINRYLPKYTNEFKEYTVKSRVTNEQGISTGIVIKFGGQFDPQLKTLASKVVFRVVNGNVDQLIAQLPDGRSLDHIKFEEPGDVAPPVGYKLKAWYMSLTDSEFEGENFSAGHVTMEWEYKDPKKNEPIQSGKIVWLWIPYIPKEK